MTHEPKFRIAIIERSTGKVVDCYHGNSVVTALGEYGEDNGLGSYVGGHTGVGKDYVADYTYGRSDAEVQADFLAGR